MTPDPNRPDRPYWPPLAALRGWWLDLRYQIGRLRVPSARDPDDAAEGTTSLSRIADPDDVDEVLGDDSFGFGDLPGISKLDPDWGKYITHLECEVERLREEWGKSDRGREDAGTEIENLRHALIWALTWIGDDIEMPKDGNGEQYEDYSGATRVAWPDNPENWA